MFTLLSSRCHEAIKGKVDEWDRRLGLFSRSLDAWLRCQRGWLYLEHIFAGPDIQRQMPSETRMFFVVDSHWRELMRRTQDNPNALACATKPGVLQMLEVSSHCFPGSLLRCGRMPI